MPIRYEYRIHSTANILFFTRIVIIVLIIFIILFIRMVRKHNAPLERRSGNEVRLKADVIKEILVMDKNKPHELSLDFFNLKGENVEKVENALFGLLEKMRSDGIITNDPHERYDPNTVIKPNRVISFHLYEAEQFDKVFGK